MAKAIALGLSILASGLTAGITLWVSLVGNPAELSYPTFVESLQAEILAVRTPLVVIVTPGILYIAATVFLMRRDRPRVYFVIAAFLFYIVASLATRLGNIPINEQVLTWDRQLAPAGWEGVIDMWWRWHLVRFVAMTTAFVLLVGVALSYVAGAPSGQRSTGLP